MLAGIFLTETESTFWPDMEIRLYLEHMRSKSVPTIICELKAMEALLYFYPN